MNGLSEKKLKKYAGYSTARLFKYVERGKLTDSDLSNITEFAQTYQLTWFQKMSARFRVACWKLSKCSKKQILIFLSKSILWICAVGGFVLSLINFFENH